MCKIIQAIITLTILLSSVTLFADDSVFQQLQQILRQNNVEVHTEQKFGAIEFDKLRTPNSEVEDAIIFLTRLEQQGVDTQSIRFFSTYAVPKELREEEVLTLSFVIHSLVGISDENYYSGNAGSFYPLAKINDDGEFESYRRVPGSETLWWIDLDEYNWTPEAWEKVSLGDGYFAEPIVQHPNSGALKILSGNAVLRSDWFIKHSTRMVEQLDLEEPDRYYHDLLYAKSSEPKNIDEWRRHWGLDINIARSLGNEFGTLTNTSRRVARHNRYLFGYNTHLGYLYETYDVKNQVGKRDYIESIFLNKKPGEPPDVSDAGEGIATNQLGLQVYVLRDAAGKIVEFADPTVARHMYDVLGDARVATPHSCMDCHASGPIPAENVILKFIESQGQLKAYKKEDALRLNRVLLDKRFQQSVKDNQIVFARAVAKCNGLLPETNGEHFLRSLERYSENITVEKAAYECGVTVDEFKSAVLDSNYYFGNRLKMLVNHNEPIPRDAWEGKGRDGIPGLFQQAMIMINGFTVINDELIDLDAADNILEITYNISLRDSDGVIERLNAGDYVILTNTVHYKGVEWYHVKTRLGNKGYIKTNEAQSAILTDDEVQLYFAR